MNSQNDIFLIGGNIIYVNKYRQRKARKKRDKMRSALILQFVADEL